jgi:hypothetical protein
MVTRVLELIPDSGTSEALCGLIEGKVRNLLSTAPGYIEQATLVAEGKPGLVVLFSMWKSRGAAEQYERELLPKIHELIQGSVQFHGEKI